MADTIRDVVIRIGLQQVNNMLKAPDTAPFEAAMKLMRSHSTAIGADFRTIRDIARDSVGSMQAISREFERSSIHAQATAAFTSTIKGEAERAAQAARATADAFFAATSARSGSESSIDPTLDGFVKLAKATREATDDFTAMTTQAAAAATHAGSIRGQLEAAAKAARATSDAFFAATNANMVAANQENAASFHDLTEAIREADAAHEMHVENVSQRIREGQRVTRGAWNDFATLQAEAQKHQALHNDSVIKAADGFRTSAEGAFMFARGIAFLSASSEEDMAVIIKNIAYVQGAFDTVKGGIDVVKGIHAATSALTAAQSAAAAAASASAAAQTAYAGATATATTSQVAFNAALLANPMIAVTAAIVAGGAAIAVYAQRSRQAAEEERANWEKVYQQNEERMNGIRARMKSSRENFDHRSSQLELEAEKQKIDILSDQMSIYDQIKKIQSQQDGNFGLGSAEEWKNRRDSQHFMGQRQGFDQQTDAARELVRILDMQEQSERRKLDLLLKQSDFKQKEVEQAKTILQTVQEQLSAEKQRNEASVVTLGQMSTGQRNRFEAISDKVKAGGELSRGEERWLRRQNIDEVNSFLDQKDAGRGTQYAGLLDSFTPQKQQKIKALEQQRDHFTMVEEEVSRDADELMEERNRQVRETADRIKQLLEQKGFAKSELAEMEERLSEIVGQM